MDYKIRIRSIDHDPESHYAWTTCVFDPAKGCWVHLCDGKAESFKEAKREARKIAEVHEENLDWVEEFTL